MPASTTPAAAINSVNTLMPGTYRAAGSTWRRRAGAAGLHLTLRTARQAQGACSSPLTRWRLHSAVPPDIVTAGRTLTKIRTAKRYQNPGRLSSSLRIRTHSAQYPDDRVLVILPAITPWGRQGAFSLNAP